jgi:hypothetical protein
MWLNQVPFYLSAAIEFVKVVVLSNVSLLGNHLWPSAKAMGTHSDFVLA